MASPASNYKVQSLDSLPIPDTLDETAEQAISKALALRPDLLAQMEEVRSANAAVTSAHSKWYPRLMFMATMAISGLMDSSLHFPAHTPAPMSIMRNFSQLDRVRRRAPQK